MMIYIITLPLSSSHQNEQPLFQCPHWRAWLWWVSLHKLTSFHFSKSVVLQMALAWCTLIQTSHESWDRREVIYWLHCWDGIAAVGWKGEHSVSWPPVPGSWTRGWLMTRWAPFDCPSPCLQSWMSSGKVLLFIVSANHICDDSDLPSSSSSLAELSAWGSGSACNRFLDLRGAGVEIDCFLQGAETSNWPVNSGEIWSILISETDSLVWSSVSLPDFSSPSLLPSSESWPELSWTCWSNAWAAMAVIQGGQAWVAKGHLTAAELPESEVKAAEALLTWGGLCLDVDSWALDHTGWESAGLSGRLLVKEGLRSLDGRFGDTLAFFAVPFGILIGRPWS